MKRRFLTMTLIGLLSATMLCACGKAPASETDTTDVSSEEGGIDGGSVSLDASATTPDVQTERVPSSEIESTEDSKTTEDNVTPPADVEVQDAAPVEKPDNIKFVIVQNARDNMFTLTNTEKQTLTIDTEAETGYTGTMKPESGEYETGGTGYYVIPYSSTLTLSDMDDDIVYVSAEYPYALSVAIQNASTVVLSEDRSVTITGKDSSSVFQYRVWMPSLGVKKESKNEVLTGQGSGTIKLYWKDSKIAVEQLTTVSENTLDGDVLDDDEDSDVATVDWRTACPWADKIATGIWSDGADLSNVKQLQEGIMSAKFTPVDEITEDAKVVNLTFYDTDKKKLGVLKFWKKGNHVEIDGKKFNYDTVGLE